MTGGSLSNPQRHAIEKKMAAELFRETFPNNLYFTPQDVTGLPNMVISEGLAS